ncbi:DUF7064 domain-containing protein [Breznakiella homolactica]|uniref:DUF7064 domain-containing protein n=1 Tax=Breznakiella homolactica TaxID=2798577 RepID=A0A7T7XQX0_9SPIR|nr:hypothetical protein [Breznakiella homolactica]QQO10842.1 hypothetical protein JFL75_07975 [Breznakiella homolactica]
MGLKTRIKTAIIKKAIDKRKAQHPFDEVYAETYTLPADADSSQNNSFYFSAHNIEGESLLFRNAYRGGGRTELWVAYKDKDGNAWVNPKQEYDNHEPTGLTITCVEPAKIWEFEFDSDLNRVRLDERRNGIPTDQTDRVKFKGRFTATAPIFEFSRHFDSLPVARALAREKFEKGFQNNLAAAHQVHYEQSGKLTAELSISGQTKTLTDMPTVRDHSFGTRDWAFMDRHVWIIALMENGDDLNFNAVRYPILRELQTGYLIKGEKRVCTDFYSSMDDYEKTNDVPLAFETKVTLADGTVMTVKAEKEMEFQFAFENRVYQFHEGIGSFDINGVKARGIIEFGFNKDEKRWNR